MKRKKKKSGIEAPHHEMNISNSLAISTTNNIHSWHWKEPKQK